MKEASLDAVDPDIAKAIHAEERRQQEEITLIASENLASAAVRHATGSVLTNKYAEGYPGRRYYGGCQYVDQCEELARQRAKTLFGADYANVQPHSGTQANLAVYLSHLEPGSTILSMDLAHGGHLSHGHPKNLAGRLFKIAHYGVDRDSELIDYDAVEQAAKESRPGLIVAGGSAYSREIDFQRFRSIADSVGALLLVDMAHFAGLVAAGVHPSPVPIADFVTSTTHKTLRGPRGGLIMCRDAYKKKIASEVFPGDQGGPLMHVIAAKAVAFGEAMTDEFRTYQQRVAANARRLAAALADRDLRIVSGGTDTHLFLVDLSSTNRTGREVEEGLEKAGITLNKNLIPFDERKPMQTSGVRIGTPIVTSRGMGEAEMDIIADLMVRGITCLDDDAALATLRQETLGLTQRFPVPDGFVKQVGSGAPDVS